MPPQGGHRRAALAVVVLSILVFAGAAPFAKLPLAPLPAFLPIYQSALVINDLITAMLLLGQFVFLRSRGLVLLGCGYLFSALMAIAHALSFPGLFAPGGWLGAGPQTTVWLYFFWHGGFPMYIAAYALTKGAPEAEPAGRSAAAAIARVVLATVVLAAGLVALATAGEAWLPPLMAGQSDGPAKQAVAALTWVAGALALVLLWRRPPHSVLDLWLMVALCVWSADSALAAVFNHARYDLGWYAGRIYGLLASSFVLGVLLLENSVLYARLVQANDAERRRSEQLRQMGEQLLEANRHLDAFAGGVAHDLRQPITTISAFTQVLSERAAPRLAPAEASYLRRIGAAAQQAHQMIQGLLEFARLGERTMQTVPVDLNRVVAQARDALADELESRPVALDVAPLPVVAGDPALLQLAFINLLSNGIKYSRASEQPQIRIEPAPDSGAGPAVRIQDNGVGFDMGAAQRLFRPFERLHSASEFEGTGLGLANVRRIMERHGGSVRAEAVPGKGATFTLVFRA
jgi:signal transduction histidine kinase